MFTLSLNITRGFEDEPIEATATILYADKPVATFTVDPYDAVVLRNDKDERDAYIVSKIAALFTVLTAIEEAK